MLFGIIIVIILFGSVVFMIWYSIKKEGKESREPLGDDIKNHYFIKVILDITNEIKNFKGEDEIKLFLQKEIEAIQPMNETTFYPNYQRAIEFPVIVFGIFGFFLNRDAYDKTFKIDQIKAIQSMWAYYLTRQLNKDNFSKKEWKKVNQNIQNKTIYLLNSKVALFTKQNDIKDAWIIILKDKSLTRKVFNQLWRQVRKMLFPEYK